MTKKINKKLNKWCERKLNDWEERTRIRSINALWQMPIVGVMTIVMLIFLGEDSILHLGPLGTMIFVIIAILIEKIIRKIIKYLF